MVYYWKVVAINAAGSATGPVWTFTVRSYAPAVAPTATAQAGSGLGSGVYQYAYTDVTTSGESLPSPLASVTTAPLAAAPLAMTRAMTITGTGGPYPFAGPFSDSEWTWAMTFVTAAGETLPGPTCGNPAGGGGDYYTQLSTIQVGPAGVTARRIYRTVRGGAQLKLVATIADNTTTTYDDHTADGALGANAPTTNTAALPKNQVALSAVAVGPTGTTARKVYRTVVGGAQLKLQQTIANNTATVGVQDATADGSLGANAPTTDTSGL
jgi:hypothetical protein